MKFAKELEQELVPEWRIKYLDYKAGKKCVKAVSRAISKVNTTPVIRRSGDHFGPRQTPRLFSAGSPFSAKRQSTARTNNDPNNSGAGPGSGSVPPEQQSLRSSPAHADATTQRHQHSPHQPTIEEDGELRSLTSTPTDRPQYGSIMNPSRIRSASVATDGSRGFELPAPAMRIPSNIEEPTPYTAAARQPHASEPALPDATKTAQPWARPRIPRSASMAVSVYRTPSGNTVGQGGESSRSPAPYEMTPKQRIRRLFSVASPQQWPMGGAGSNTGAGEEYDMRGFDEVREREVDFFKFLDSELNKVETFYKLKEEQAGERLTLLREQLHEMRNRRIDEIQQAKRRGEEGGEVISPGGSGDDEARTRVGSRGSGLAANGDSGHQSETDNENKGWDVHQEWIAPLKAKIFKPGPNSKALQKMPQTPRMMGNVGGVVIGGGQDPRRDYVRRPGDHDIPYRTAKRKLKLALQEFYRGLELLKSYAILNRTAFRKLNKKYDKAVNARPPYRYMNEKVNRSWFVNSTIVDDLIVATEDLYARYFERGNHKIAAGKLRALTKRPGDESGSAFRNGIMIGVGAVFAIQGTVDGSRMLFDPSAVVREQATYLLQIYGGYFLMLYLFTLFCIDCRVWTINKVNYPFIFEFDPRSHLDWRQLSQFPSFFFLVFGLFMWLNFSDAADPRLYLYYPVILIGFTFILLFFPAPTLWHRSRKWFLYSHWRLFFAGWYPVEFRDFFLGDIYCSLVYSTCNIELFFCIYAHAWNNPSQCNSNHSRLLGFFSTLPPIWRLLQCLRRYRDTRNVFPHLVNGGKYTMTILSYVTLSLYRIEESHRNLALFIAFSTVNSFYTSFWDLFMDFSLLQAGSRNFLLRDILALKRRWLYYVIMIVDPILRFSWIFYAIFTHDTQHSSICSFLVSFAEATRRGMWVLLRVENEHCANVAQYKASRDVPLPYHLHEVDSMEQGQPLLSGDVDAHDNEGADASAGADGTPSLSAARRTSTIISTPGRATMTAGGSIRSNRHQTGTSAAEPWPIPDQDNATATEEGLSTSAAGTPSQQVMQSGTLRRRITATLGKSIGSIMANAHKQDFEKKRKPGLEVSSPIGRPGAVDDIPSSDDEHDPDGTDGDSGDSDAELDLVENGGNHGYRDDPSQSQSQAPASSDRGGSSLRRGASRPH